MDFTGQEDQPAAPVAVAKRPDPAWVRGRCPKCGEDVVSNMYYLSGKGYFIFWECWNKTSEPATCDYSKQL